MRVPDRRVAIALILSNRIPIPVPLLQERPRSQPVTATTPGKLEVITGDRISDDAAELPLCSRPSHQIV